MNLGSPPQQAAAEELFEGLLKGQWQLEPAGEFADISFAQEVIDSLALRLPYPEEVRIAQLKSTDSNFEAFSALFHQKGWIFLRAGADTYEINYYRHLLTASLGLQGLYTTEASLQLRAEQLVFDLLLPATEVESFFRADIVKIPAFLAADIASHFHVPFPVVLRRALQLALISDVQYQNFMAVRPESHTKPRDLFVAQDGDNS
ncbi:hypothetical protein [Dyadobacter tibetensis]|uniref:hypothetical protein n=1 Tax=Dyadobacter tibetensis TaxID=1211851 RepID=UPI0004B3A2E7|nr:hypothetical protein [Dyadobacter tibetensis]